MEGGPIMEQAYSPFSSAGVIADCLHRNPTWTDDEILDFCGQLSDYAINRDGWQRLLTAARSRSAEADLVDGIVMDDHDISDNEIIIMCMRDARFNHTPEEWLQIIRDWREEYGRVTESIGVSLETISSA